MALIDFKEIPSSRGGQPGQDLWEIFARDFLEAIGCKIEEGPSRGTDLGKDLLVVETASGAIKEHPRKWVVSCKHYVHNGASVSESHEANILERIKQNNADGFLGFYSTLPSSSLETRLVQLKQAEGIEYFFYDSARIETLLISKISEEKIKNILRRYFPLSFKKLFEKEVSKYLERGYMELTCDHCGKDLIATGQLGNLVFVRDSDKDENIIGFYVACKGECDHTLEHRHIKNNGSCSWDDVVDIFIPYLFMNKIMAAMNRMRDGKDVWVDEKAFTRFKYLLLAAGQMVFRQNVPEDLSRIDNLKKIPSWLGGLGQDD